MGSSEAYLRSLKPPIRDIAAALRAMILASVSQLEETIKYGSPHYGLPGTAGTVVYIADASRHVNLGFYDGALLKDRKGLLEGTGKRLRHVKVHTLEEARNPALAALVREAVRFRRETGPPPKGWR